MAIKMRTPEEIAARVAKAEARLAAQAEARAAYGRTQPPIEFAPAISAAEFYRPLPSSAAAFRAKTNRR